MKLKTNRSVQKMRALELFCGTHSIGKILEARGWEVVSLDNDAKAGATICADVLMWDYTICKPRAFEYIHASPPCCEYSRALTTRPRDLESADAVVNRTLEILWHLRPRWFTIENPYTGLMKDRPMMAFLKPWLQRVCYCTYANGNEAYSYRKETAIWTNLPWTPRQLCTAKTPCQWRRDNGGVHPRVAQRGGSGSGVAQRNRNTQAQLFSIPPALIAEWVDSIQ